MKARDIINEESPKATFRQLPRSPISIHVSAYNRERVDVMAKAYFIDETHTLGEEVFPGVWVSSMTLAKALGEHSPGPGPWYDTHLSEARNFADEIQACILQGIVSGTCHSDDSMIAWDLVCPQEMMEFFTQTQRPTRDQADALLARYGDDSEIIKKFDGRPSDWEDRE